MSRVTAQPEQAPRVTDLLIRQKCEAMIEYGYVALRSPEPEQFVEELIPPAPILG